MDERIRMVPRDMSIDELKTIRNDKILFAFPACLKSNECPHGKDNGKCSSDCDMCKVSSLIKIVEVGGFKHFCVAKDDALIEHLKGNGTSYKTLVGIACPIEIAKLTGPISSNFGLRGVTIPIQGITCKDDKEYHDTRSGKIRRDPTDIDLALVQELIDNIK